jgi:Asp-tRNA(Asn)/Glu-tRNA(Gln) amidotransferase A subunit family amidase
MTRSVADAALMQNVMSGPHADDVCSLREQVRIPEPGALGSIEGWKVAFSIDLGYLEVDPEVQANTRAALEVFRDLGCRVEEVDVGWTWKVYDSWITRWEGMFAASAGHLLSRWREQMDPFVVHLLERGAEHSAAHFYQGNAYRGEMYRRLAPILESHDVLIAPTTGLPSIPADHAKLDDEVRINDKLVPSYVGWVLTHGFNLISYCPVMSVPSGVSACGVPTGIQIVGRSFDDLRVFWAAAAYEAANPWRPRRPRL